MIFLNKNNIKDNMPEQGSAGFVSAMVELLEPKQKTILLKKEYYVNIQKQINAYLKQPWVSADRKKTAHELRDGIAKFKGNAITFEEISSLLLNAQNKISEQDKKRLVIKKKYSRLHQVITNIIQEINHYYTIESQLQTNPMAEEIRENIERAKQAGGIKVFYTDGKNEPRLLPEAVMQRDLKNSSKFIRGYFKAFYPKIETNLSKGMEEMQTMDQQTMPLPNSIR